MLHSPEPEVTPYAETYSAQGTLPRISSTTIQQYAPMVRRIAYHMMGRLPASVQLDDLLQAGMMGLMDALSRYDDSQGIAFETYAQQRIRGAILDELRAYDWLPRSARRTLRDIEAAMHRLQQRLGHTPSEREVATELGVSLEAYQDMLLEAKGCHLLHYDELGEGEEAFFEHHPGDAQEEPQARLADKRFYADLVEAIQQLPEREQLMMSLYYEQDLNFREIAEVLGVSESRVCQIHTQIIARIRAKLRDWR